MAVYLLHCTVPLVLPDGREVRHYLGWVRDGHFPNRLREHLTGRHSARIVQAFLNNGGELCLGNYYPHLPPAEEQKMKRAGHIGSRCLVCKRNALQHQIREITALAHQSTPQPTEQ